MEPQISSKYEIEHSPIPILFLYAFLSFILSVFSKPRHSLFLLSFLIYETIRSINLSAKTQQNQALYNVDNFLYEKSGSLVKYCILTALLTYIGRLGFVNYKIYRADNHLLQFSAYLLSMIINACAFSHGALLAQFFPNSNEINAKWIYKGLVLMSLLSTMIPLAFVSSNKILERLYVSTFFLTICGYIWGVYSTEAKNKRVAWYIKVTAFIYAIGFSIILVNNQILWHLNQN